MTRRKHVVIIHLIRSLFMRLCSLSLCLSVPRTSHKQPHHIMAADMQTTADTVVPVIDENESFADVSKNLAL